MSEMLTRGLGLLLLSGLLCELLKQFGWRGAPAITALAAVGIFGIFGRALSELAGQILHISELGGISRYAEAVLKILAAGLVSGAVSDALSELSCAGMARTAITVGRMEILAISLPFISEIIDMGVSLVS